MVGRWGAIPRLREASPLQQLTLILQSILSLDRSTEEIIALFISITFVVDAVKGMVKSKCLASGHLLQMELS